MARRKNTRFVDPRYFMDEKTETIDEMFGFGNKAKRRKELEGFIEQYDVKGFLTQLMRAVTNGERLPHELEDLSDLVGQDSATLRQQLKTVIRQGGALHAFADSLGGDYGDAVGVIENIVEEDPEMFNALMKDAASNVGPMAPPEQRMARSHR